MIWCMGVFENWTYLFNMMCLIKSGRSGVIDGHPESTAFIGLSLGLSWLPSGGLMVA